MAFGQRPRVYVFHFTPLVIASHKLIIMSTQSTTFMHKSDWDGMSVQHKKVSGLDLSSSFHCCYVLPSLVPKEKSNVVDGGFVCDFDADQAGLEALIVVLKSFGVEEVIMESTGIYWFGVYRMLITNGIEVCLVNPVHTRSIAGKKTDENDARWLCRLLAYGLVKKSFVLNQESWELRDLMRQRDQLIKDKSRYVNLMISELDKMNVKLHKVISDVTSPGGMTFIRFIAQGVPPVDFDWTSLMSKWMRVPKDDLQKAMKGAYSRHGCFLLQQHLESFDKVGAQMEALDIYVEKILCSITHQIELQDVEANVEEDTKFIKPLRGKKGKISKTASSKNAPMYDLRYYLEQWAGVDMTTLPGVEVATVLNIFSEIGTDLKDKFPSSKHFTSWLQLAPNPKISAGKVIGKKRVTSVNRVHELFRNCAYSLSGTKGYFGQYYRSIKMKSNGRTANKALARKLAVIFYTMLTQKQTFNEELFIQSQYKKDKALERLKKKAAQQGYTLVKTQDKAA